MNRPAAIRLVDCTRARSLDVLQFPRPPPCRDEKVPDEHRDDADVVSDVRANPCATSPAVCVEAGPRRPADAGRGSGALSPRPSSQVWIRSQGLLQAPSMKI